MFAKSKAWVRAHPKLTAAIGAAAVAAGAYYGVPPEVSGPVLTKVCTALAVCPAL